MSQRFSSTSRVPARRGESGYFMMLVAGSIVAILIIAFFAVGVANITRTQLRLQKATDAAAIGAMSVGRAKPLAIVQQVAEKLVIDNLATANVTLVPGSLVVTPQTYPGSTFVRSIDIRAQAYAPVFLLNLLPGMMTSSEAGNGKVVSAQSEAKLRPIMVSLVLDVSGSMNDPSGGGSGSTKIAVLRQAVSSFISDFKEGLDFFSIVTFNSSAQVRYPMQILDKNNASNSGALDIVAGLTASGATDTPHGMKLGVDQLGSIPSPPADLIKVLILVTDGVPHYDHLNNASNDSPRDFPVTARGGASSVCASYQGNGGAPYDNDSVVDTFHHGALFMRPIAESDRARKVERALVYTIGVGGNACDDPVYSTGPNPPSVAACFNDPFQILSRAGMGVAGGYLRSTFLARIANRRIEYSHPSLPGPSHKILAPDFAADCALSFNEIANDPRGDYFESPNAEDLAGFFSQIESKVLAILTK